MSLPITWTEIFIWKQNWLCTKIIDKILFNYKIGNNISIIEKWAFKQRITFIETSYLLYGFFIISNEKRLDLKIVISCDKLPFLETWWNGIFDVFTCRISDLQNWHVSAYLFKNKFSFFFCYIKISIRKMPFENFDNSTFLLRNLQRYINQLNGWVENWS